MANASGTRDPDETSSTHEGEPWDEPIVVPIEESIDLPGSVFQFRQQFQFVLRGSETKVFRCNKGWAALGGTNTQNLDRKMVSRPATSQSISLIKRFPGLIIVRTLVVRHRVFYALELQIRAMNSTSNFFTFTKERIKPARFIVTPDGYDSLRGIGHA